jgi:PRTRC genetic system protein B
LKRSRNGRNAMKVHISIGENHRFALREALLVYGDSQKSFITRHEIAGGDKTPPTLGPAQPLTVGFVESLVRSLHGSVAAEVLPENVLAKGDRMVVWWTPAQRRQMFYKNSEGKCAALNGRTFPQPALVWKVANGELSIRALGESRRPAPRRSLPLHRSGTSRPMAVCAPGRCVARTTHRSPAS